MRILPAAKRIYVKESGIPGAGRGVYAGCDIKKGETIEVCPVIEIPEHDSSNLVEGILVTYIYYYGRNKEKSLISLGFGSIYNHTYEPNAFYKIDEKEGIITFAALKNIKKDSEITVNYNQSSPKNTAPLWFEKTH